jgi:mono-ADP-ribosyltransferase sirtuin 6
MVKLEGSRRPAITEPFVISLRDKLISGTQLNLELEFMGHYGEPNLEIVYKYDSEADAKTLYLLAYNPATGEWKTSKDGIETATEANEQLEANLTSAANRLAKVNVAA